jgi:hypothetical protein
MLMTTAAPALRRAANPSARPAASAKTDKPANNAVKPPSRQRFSSSGTNAALPAVPIAPSAVADTKTAARFA